MVELAPKIQLFKNPRHTYTEALLSAVPVPDPFTKKKRIPLHGEIGDSLNRPGGCPFHPRCPYAQDICKTEKPNLTDLSTVDSAPHIAACHFAEELALNGV